MSMISKAYKIPEEQFIQIIKQSSSCAEAMRTMGYNCTTGNSYTAVKRRIAELNLDVSHWADNTKNAHVANKIPQDKYFAINTPHSGGHTRKRLLKDGLMEYKCSLCGNTGEWNGQPLVLQVDHINGDHNDNRLENLRFLCPNCHSQTETFAGKNLSRKTVSSNHKEDRHCIECGASIADNNPSGLCNSCAKKKNRKTERPSKEVLLQEIATSSFVAVAAKYGVTDTAVIKWCKTYGLPSKKKDIIALWNQMKHDCK